MCVPFFECDVLRFRNWIREVTIRNRYLLEDRACYTINNRNCLDFAIRFENLKSGVREVCQILDIERDVEEMPRFVSGIRPERNLTDFYDAPTRDAIQQLFEIEIKQFGYEFPE